MSGLSVSDPFDSMQRHQPHDRDCGRASRDGGLMNALDVKHLQETTTYPAVSLLLPIDGDSLARVRLRLRHLAANAIDRLRKELDPVEAGALADRLSATVEGVELTEGQKAVAVYVGDRTALVALPVRVRERVVVDDTFATRDLVRALQRSPRYRVAVLGPKRTRLYEGTGLGLTEVDGNAFALAPANAGGRASVHIATRGRVSREVYRDRGGRTGIDKFIRAFDDALDPYLRDDPLPLVLVGTEPRLGAVASRSRHRELIVGTARGAHDFPDRDALSRLVWPTIDTMLRRQTADAVGELERSGGGPRYASGVGEVWMLANQGRGDLLLVEEGFEYAARVDPVTGEAAFADDRDAPGVVDDLVDEVIEAVLAKRGRCHIVPDGHLAQHDRIAMKLRY
jgi:hypothetical protein